MTATYSQQENYAHEPSCAFTKGIPNHPWSVCWRIVGCNLGRCARYVFVLMAKLTQVLGPKPFDYRPEDNEITVNAIDEPFTAYIDASKLNQRIVLTAYVLNSKVAVGNSNYYTLNFTTSLKGLNPTTGAWEVMSEPSIHSRTIECVPV